MKMQNKQAGGKTDVPGARVTKSPTGKHWLRAHISSSIFCGDLVPEVVDEVCSELVLQKGATSNQTRGYDPESNPGI